VNIHSTGEEEAPFSIMVNQNKLFFSSWIY
jgi:hypothetical protein